MSCKDLLAGITPLGGPAPHHVVGRAIALAVNAYWSQKAIRAIEDIWTIKLEPE